MLPNKNLLTAICLLLSAAGLFTSSCNIINPTEPVPTYVHIDSFAMVHNDSLTPGTIEGSFSRKITAVYVYYNNNPIGVFNLPITFPIICDAPGQVSIFPAIDVNGLSGVNLIYPFYAPDAFTLQPQPGATVNHVPVTKYPNATNFPFNNNFDDVNTPKFTLVSGSGGTYNIALRSSDPTNVFEGDGSGHIHLQNAGDTSVIISDSITPHEGVEAYVEFNYKGTVPAQVGFTAATQLGDYTEYVIGLNPRATWGKFYIPVRAFIASHYGLLRILVRTQVPSDQAGGDFYIDNVKLVTF